MTKILSDAPPSATYYSLVIYKLSMVNLCFQKRCPLSSICESSSSLHNDHFITVREWKLTAIGFVVPNARSLEEIDYHYRRCPESQLFRLHRLSMPTHEPGGTAVCSER